MKKVYFTLALAALLTAGCSQNEELSVIDPIGNNNALTATFDGVTRTTTTNGSNTQWTAEDIIYVGASGTMDAYKLSSGGGATTGVFTPVSANAEPTGYAVYGASGTPTISGTTVTGLSIPSTITYNSTKNCENVIMMGKVNTENKTVSFKNAGAILYVKIGNGISVSTAKVEANYNIAGDATVDWNNGEPTYSITGSDPKTTIEVTGASSQDIVIPLPPSEDTKTITLSLNNKTIFSGQIKVERNKYYKIEYNNEGDMIANIESGLIEALNAPTASHVTIVNNVTIAGSTEQTRTTPNPKGMELDLNEKTLTIASGQNLEVVLNGDTGETDKDPVFKICNGTIKVLSNSTITCYVNKPCKIELDNCKFVTEGEGTFTINIIIPDGVLQGLKTDSPDYISLYYPNTYINGSESRYKQICYRTDQVGNETIEHSSTSLGSKLVLNFKRQSSSN